MAVMVTFTLKTDAVTYQSLQAQMLAVARPAGLLFRSGRAVGNDIGIVDFWPNEEIWRKFSEGPLAAGMKAAGIAPPDDLKIVPCATMTDDDVRVGGSAFIGPQVIMTLLSAQW